MAWGTLLDVVVDGVHAQQSFGDLRGCVVDWIGGSQVVGHVEELVQPCSDKYRLHKHDW